MFDLLAMIFLSFAFLSRSPHLLDFSLGPLIEPQFELFEVSFVS
jgi:hypothetical protein